MCGEGGGGRRTMIAGVVFVEGGQELCVGGETGAGFMSWGVCTVRGHTYYEWIRRC